MRDTVILKRAADYGAGLAAAVEDILVRCGVDELLPGKRNVLVKPNLLMRSGPDEATATHPAVAEAVVCALKKHGAKEITIADSPGGPYSAALLRSVYKGCGMIPLAEIPGVTLNLGTGSRGTAVPDGHKIKVIELTEAVADADLIVSVGKLKTHVMSGMTAAVKNLFGAVPGLVKAEMHTRFPKREDFCDLLIDLAELIRPQISLVDGIVGMEGDGPSGGTPRAFGILGGSRNPYYLDRALAHCIGFSPDEALTVGASVARGLAPREIGALPLEDETGLAATPFSDIKRPRSIDMDLPIRLPAPVKALAKTALRALGTHPAVVKEKCAGCGKCAEVCPRQTIGIAAGTARIEKRSCIRCFCCHELCPERAVDIRRGPRWTV